MNHNENQLYPDPKELFFSNFRHLFWGKVAEKVMNFGEISKLFQEIKHSDH